MRLPMTAQTSHPVPGPRLDIEMSNVETLLKYSYLGDTQQRPYVTVYDIAIHNLRTKYDGKREHKS